MNTLALQLTQLELQNARVRELKQSYAEAMNRIELDLTTIKQIIRDIISNIDRGNLSASKLMIHELIWEKNIDVDFKNEIHAVMNRMRNYDN